MKTNETINQKASFSPIADTGIQPGLRKKKSRASGLPSFLSNQWSSRQFQSRCAASIGAFLEKRMNQLITLLTWVAGHRQSARKEPFFSKMELADQLWSFKKNRKLKKEAKEERRASDSNLPSSCAGESSRQQKHPERTSILSKRSSDAGGYRNNISVKNLQKNGYKDRNRPIRCTVTSRNAIRPHLIARGYQDRTRTDPHTQEKVEDLWFENLSKRYPNPIRIKLLLNRYQQETPAVRTPLNPKIKSRYTNFPFRTRRKCSPIPRLGAYQ